MKIKTELLKEMVSKAIRGASLNKMIPITNLIGIDIDGDKLELITTDGSNQLKVIEKVENVFEDLEYKSFYSIVDVDTFSKLVGKTTKEYIQLENNENYLNIKGNGEYKLEIPVDEEGNLVKFPEMELKSDNIIELSIEVLKNIIISSKPSVSKTMEIPFLTGYYISTNSISTDRQLACLFNTNIELPDSMLISGELAELLLLLEGDKVKLIKENNKLMFETPGMKIIGKELEGKEDYPVEAILNLSKLEYNKSVKIDKKDILDVLDRMSLFVNDYDRNGVKLSFSKEGLYIRSQKSNAEELVEYHNTIEIEEPFNCLIDIDMFKSQIQTISSELVEIYFGQQKMIKLIDGNSILFISLLSEEN